MVCVTGGFDGMGAVFDHLQAVRMRYLKDLLHLATAPAHVHDHTCRANTVEHDSAGRLELLVVPATGA